MIEKSIWVRDVLSFLDTRGLCGVQYICKSLALNADSDWKLIVMCRWPSLGPNIDLLASCMGNCKELYFRRAHAFAGIGTVARPLTRRPVLPTDLMFGLAISHGGIVAVETTFSIQQNLENRHWENLVDDFIILSIPSVTLMRRSGWCECHGFRCSVIVQDVASGSVAPVLSLGEPMANEIREYIDACAQQSMGVTPEHTVVGFTRLAARMIDLHFTEPWRLQTCVDLCVVLVLDDPLETLELASVTASRVILKFSKTSNTNQNGRVEYNGGTPSVRELLGAFARLRQYVLDYS